MSLSHGNSQIVRDGLVLYLDAANEKSYPGTGTTWYDLSGYNNNATIINSPAYSSNYSGYFSFVEASAQWASINSTNEFPFGNSPGTISGWANTNTTSTSWEWIIAYGTGSNDQTRSIGTNGTDYVVTSYGTGRDVFVSGVTVSSWFNIVGVYSAGVEYCYINGVLQGSKSIAFNTVSGVARIGQQTNSANEFWSGNISSVQVYNRALTAAEVQQNFNTHRGRYNL